MLLTEKFARGSLEREERFLAENAMENITSRRGLYSEVRVRGDTAKDTPQGLKPNSCLGQMSELKLRPPKGEKQDAERANHWINLKVPREPSAHCVLRLTAPVPSYVRASERPGTTQAA